MNVYLKKLYHILRLNVTWTAYVATLQGWNGIMLVLRLYKAKLK